MSPATIESVAVHRESAAWFVHRRGIVPETTPGQLSDVLHLLGGGPDPWAESCAVRQTRVRAGTMFCEDGAAAEALHVVRTGSFKCVKIGEDGYEHVLGFVGRGEVLGFEGMALGHQPFGVSALEDSSVFALPLPQLDAWRRQSPAFDHALQGALGRQLAHAGDIAEMMAPVAAEVRLARFLVWLSARMAAYGESPRRFLLRMNRRDIASFLAVAHETVSRCFGVLAEEGYIEVDNREIEIVDLAGLKACTRCTRRPTEDEPRRAGHPHSTGHHGAAAASLHQVLGRAAKGMLAKPRELETECAAA